MRRLIFLALVLLTSVVPAQATIFFDENFETAVVPLDPSKLALDVPTFNAQGFQGAPPGWALTRSGRNGAAFDPNLDECFFTTEQAHSGSKSLKVQYFRTQPDGNPGGIGECGLCKSNDCGGVGSLGIGLPDVLEFWWRAWVRPHNYGINMAPGASANKVIYWKTTGSSGYPNALLQFFQGGGGVVPAIAFQNSQDCFDGGGNFIPNCFTTWNGYANQGLAPMTQDVWHCIEGHYKMNSVTGTTANRDAVFEQWLDGNLATRYTNFAFRAGTVSITNASVDARFRPLFIYRQGAAVGSVMYWDDIATGDQRIGCGVIPPASVPNAPATIQLTKNWLKRIWAWLLPNWA